MPNWTHNTLIVTGKDVSKFRKVAKSKKSSLSFNNFIPMPKELIGREEPSKGNKDKKLIKKYGADNWYDWHCENWGTKWDAVRTKLIANKKNELAYHFDTAWAPPIAWLRTASKKFPSLKLVLDCTEEMGNFVGTATAINGKVNEDFEQMNDGEFYEVIALDGENPMIVKFLDKGLSLTLFRRIPEDEKVIFQGKTLNNERQHLFKVEYKGKVKMLELPDDFAFLMSRMRVKGKTYMVIRKIIENEECFGMKELPELNTIENFNNTYDWSTRTIHKKPDKNNLPF
ncbi:MAG TPA: hypothetical protein VK254_03200 [Candidatus Bathyarchaeia archaeon]|nr:hypothetical protein [Candidatus Bathyarchaeia archaeon]